MPPDPLPITPETDPEIIFLADELKRMKTLGFYGTITIHLERGVALRYTKEESTRVPMKHLPPEGIALVRGRGRESG